jgi:hypothetical protein
MPNFWTHLTDQARHDLICGEFQARRRWQGSCYRHDLIVAEATLALS